MIRGTSITTDQPNIEQMLVSGEEVAGSGQNFICNLFREDLTVAEQAIYDDAIALVADTYYTEINNTTSALDISRVTSTVLADGTDVIDFQSLSVADQDKLRAFLALVIAKKD